MGKPHLKEIEQTVDRDWLWERIHKQVNGD